MQERRTPSRGEDSKSKARIPSGAGWFTLWLEFEGVVFDPPVDPYKDFFNCIIRTEDGRDCALNVWTFGVLGEFIEHDRASGENLSGRYLLPPDLLVEKAERKLMEDVVRELLERGDLEERLNREQVGFRVMFTMQPELSLDERNELISRFDEEAMARAGLDFSGVLMGGGCWDGFVSPHMERRDATEDDRRFVDSWLSAEVRVIDHCVGPLTTDWEAPSDGDE